MNVSSSKQAFILLFVLVLFAFQSTHVTKGVTVVEVKYHSSVTKGAKFVWNIKTIKTADNKNSWTWNWANNIVLKQGEEIVLEWIDYPDETTDIGIAGPILNTGLTTSVGSRLLNFSRYETFFNFFIVPLYVNNTLGKLESGLRVIERFWFNSYHLPNSYLPGVGMTEYIWNFDITNASLENTGVNGSSNTIVLGFITTHDFFDVNSSDPETYVFDIAYASDTGFVKWMKYPSSGQNDFPIANNSTDMTKNLDELLISYSGQVSKSIPSFHLPIVISGLFAAIVIIKKIGNN